MTQEALKLALEALLHVYHEDEAHPKTLQAINAIKEALAQSEQEPVAWFSPLGNLYKTRFHATANGEQVITPLYTTPQCTWVGLTDEEVDECYYWKDRQWTTDELVRHVEAKLKENNNSLQPEQEHNFCPRCGKRNKDIHTCTPPQD